MILALPFYSWVAATDAGRRRLDRSGLQRAIVVGAAAVPAVVFAFWYDAVRFGSPLESGYAIATLPPFLAVLRAQGLFSLVHVPRNLEYFLLHRPVPGGPPLFLRPDGLGLSVFITSPGLLLALTNKRWDPFLRGCGLTALAVFVPSLLYYGGGWIQLGYRYFLDAIPFLLPLLGAASRPRLAGRWKALIGFGILIAIWATLWFFGF